MRKRPTSHFGNGSFVGDFLHPENDTLELEPRDLARKLGYVAGCPVVERLTEPENTKPGRGSEAMIERYGEVSFWYGEMVWRLDEQNRDLFIKEMAWPIARRIGDKERITAFDEPSIPEDHFAYMRPLGTLYGYALPRIMIEEIRGQEYSAQDTVSVQDRMIVGLEAFEHIASNASDMYELTAKFAEAIAQLDGDPEAILGHILAPGWLEEHGAVWMFNDMREAVKKYAPTLWQEYIS